MEEMTSEQKEALEALALLQISTDKKNQLYSTFAGMEHACYPPDTSILITQAEFLQVMTSFINKHCKNLPSQDRQVLSTRCVLAQSEYLVSYCPENIADLNYDTGIPRQGIWLIPKILDRIDLTLLW